MEADLLIVRPKVGTRYARENNEMRLPKSVTVDPHTKAISFGNWAIQNAVRNLMNNDATCGIVYLEVDGIRSNVTHEVFQSIESTEYCQ